MAADGGGREGRKADPPPRPTIALPPRSSFESLFRGGGGSEVSPGPMTLVSSFFAEDPDSDCRSFSQLLAGAMASPVAAPMRRPATFLPAAAAEESACRAEERTLAGSGGGGGGRILGLSQNRPMSLLVAQSPFFTVPPGLSPGGFLESPALFSPNLGPFGISHQQALAQVTAQAAQSHSHMHLQAEFPSSLSAATASSLTQSTDSAINMAKLQHIPSLTSDTNNDTFESSKGSHGEKKYQPTALIVDKPADDGYNWRKYGQKQVKGSEYPRSYYKCTHPQCPVKKKVERSLDGQVTEIIYKGQHNHQPPPPNRRGKEGGSLPSGSNELSGNLDFSANSESVSQGGPRNFSRSSEIMTAPSTSKRDRESGHGTSEQLSGSSDGEEVGDAELGADEGGDSGPDPKRRNIETRVTESPSSHKTVAEPRIIVQTTSEVDLLDDGYRWRKYGQKVVKGNPHPRSYYKCTTAGCSVRKHVERASTDVKAVITTYEGKHNHDVPAARNSSHNTASANITQPKVHSTIPNNQAFLKRPDLRNNVQRPVAVLQLKEEHEMA